MNLRKNLHITSLFVGRIPRPFGSGRNAQFLLSVNYLLLIKIQNAMFFHSQNLLFPAGFRLVLFFLRYQCYALDVARGNEIDSHPSCLCAKLRPGTYPRFCLSALLALGTYLRFLGSQETYPLVFAHWTFVGTCR